jgi:nitroreductase
MQPSALSDLIRTRRAVFPETYNDAPVSTEEIRQILENANWAPTHKKTEPWRFVVFHEDGLKTLSDWLAMKYQAHATKGGDFSEAKQEKFRQKVLRSQCVLGICMQRDPKLSVPEWEEIAALGCAVQNMWLTCTAYGIGCYWSTPGFVIDTSDMPGMQEDWKCKGLFYMGRWDQKELPAVRNPVESKVVWV